MSKKTFILLVLTVSLFCCFGPKLSEEDARLVFRKVRVNIDRYGLEKKTAVYEDSEALDPLAERGVFVAKQWVWRYGISIYSESRKKFLHCRIIVVRSTDPRNFPDNKWWIVFLDHFHFGDEYKEKKRAKWNVDYYLKIDENQLLTHETIPIWNVFRNTTQEDSELVNILWLAAKDFSKREI